VVSGRSVTAKAMAILGAFEDGPPTLSLTAIAAAADLPMPTAHRLVGELVAWGALRRDESGRYRLGRRIWRIGQNAGRELRDSARRHLTDLIATTGESCHLAIRDEDQALVVDRLYGSGSGRSAPPLTTARSMPRTAPHTSVGRDTTAGDRFPLHACAVGQVLLAFESQWIREGYLGRLERPERRRLADELAALRRRGYAALVEEATAGYALAVPVLTDAEHAAAAIGLASAGGDRATVRRYVAALHQAARRMAPEARRWPNQRAVVGAFDGPLAEGPEMEFR
jgi:DNA-binding IclR family transcriptional regulator